MKLENPSMEGDGGSVLLLPVGILSFVSQSYLDIRRPLTLLHEVCNLGVLGVRKQPQHQP